MICSVLGLTPAQINALRAAPSLVRDLASVVHDHRWKALFEDVLGAVRYLHANGAAHVSVVGGSMGGGAAGEAAVRASPGEIDRIVLLSPAPVATPERVGGDKLVVASEHEPAVDRIKALYEKMPEPKRLVLLPGTAHAQHIFATEQGERLTATVTDFLSR